MLCKSISANKSSKCHKDAFKARTTLNLSCQPEQQKLAAQIHTH